MVSKYHDIFEEGRYYHIFNRTINKELLFLNDENYNFFLSQWNKYFDGFLSVFAYSLMPNHFHIFAQVVSSSSSNINEELEEKCKRFFSSYTLSFNNQNRRKGSLFQKRFKRILVDKDDYFTKIIHYIHNNPIHHGIADSYEKWKYSSYNAIVSNGETKVNRKEVLDWFGGKENFILFHQQNVDFRRVEKYTLEE